jgi:hypothetical protein
MKLASIFPAAAAAVFAFAVSASAQTRALSHGPVGAGMPSAAAPKIGFRMKKPLIDDKLRSPLYNASGERAQSSQKAWLRVSVEYETQNEWTDQLDFTFYVLVRSAKNGERVDRVFRKTVSYVDIAKGRHVADVFIRPNTFARMEAKAVQAAVVVSVRGADGMAPYELGSESTLEQREWWKSIPSVEGTLFNRDETPFAFIACDNYELIKREPPRGDR